MRGEVEVRGDVPGRARPIEQLDRGGQQVQGAEHHLLAACLLLDCHCPPFTSVKLSLNLRNGFGLGKGECRQFEQKLQIRHVRCDYPKFHRIGGKRNGDFTIGNDCRPPCLLDTRAVVRIVNSIRGVAACLLALGPGTAHAGPGKGALGPESRATIAISISVMPRFRLSTQGGAASLSSNAPRLRYEVVEQPLTNGQLAAEAARRAPAAPALLVVSPD